MTQSFDPDSGLPIFKAHEFWRGPNPVQAGAITDEDLPRVTTVVAGGFLVAAVIADQYGRVREIRTGLPADIATVLGYTPVAASSVAIIAALGYTPLQGLGITPGTYTQVTVNADGLVTTGATAAVAGRFLGLQVFSAGHGTYTYTPTAGMGTCVCLAIGAGGSGGGGASAGAGACGAGSGGQAGSTAQSKLTAAQIGASQTVTIGQGGVVGTAGNNPGVIGADTSLGTLVVAKGGSPGAGMASGTSLIASQPGGTSPSSTGDLTSIGQPGGAGFRLSGTAAVSGVGGSCQWGGGAASQVGQGQGPGQGFGSGGNGGLAFSTNQTGGAGADGLVIIWEYS